MKGEARTSGQEWIPGTDEDPGSHTDLPSYLGLSKEALLAVLQQQAYKAHLPNWTDEKRGWLRIQRAQRRHNHRESRIFHCHHGGPGAQMMSWWINYFFVKLWWLAISAEAPGVIVVTEYYYNAILLRTWK